LRRRVRTRLVWWRWQLAWAIHGRGNVKEGGVEGDGEGDEGKNEDEDNDEEVEDDNQNANTEGAEKESGMGKCYGDEVDDDDANSDMARSDILVSLPISDEEKKVSSLATRVTRQTEFQQTGMSNPQLSNG
jgi:hypothetical protein